MLCLVIASTFIALSLGASVPDATLDPDFIEWEGRIVGGQTATPGQFPYQTSLRNLQNSHFCGGFIINTRWTGSAAHCTIDMTPSEMVVVVGAHTRLIGGITHTIERIVNHEFYSSVTMINDISLMKTVNPIVESSVVSPIALGSTVVTSGNAVVSGWGQTSQTGSASFQLQFVSTTIITNSACRSRLPTEQSQNVFDSTLCTSPGTGRGTCMGDSGGPLVVNNQLAGAVSWGIPCARGFPDMYTRISSYNSWIAQNVNT